MVDAGLEGDLEKGEGREEVSARGRVRAPPPADVGTFFFFLLTQAQVLSPQLRDLSRPSRGAGVCPNRHAQSALGVRVLRQDDAPRADGSTLERMSALHQEREGRSFSAHSTPLRSLISPHTSTLTLGALNG